MTANRSMIVRGNGGGAATSAVVDVSDEVPSPGDTVTVYVQLVDAAGNGVALAGAVVPLSTTGAAVGTLGAASVTTDSNGRATTTLAIDGGATAGDRLSVVAGTVTLP